MPDKPYTLRDFVMDQMHSRDMSAREFAISIGVSNSTINRIVDPRNTQEPDLESITKLARGTKTNLRHLLALAYPDMADLLNEKVAPHVLVLAEMVHQLSEADQEILASFVRDRANRSRVPDEQQE